VEVHEGQDRRAAAGRVGDEVAADAGLREDVVVEAVAEDPLVRRAPGALLGHARAHVLERARVHEVGAAGVERAQERVQVAVGDAGHDRRAAQVDDLGRAVRGRPDLGVVAHRDDAVAGDADGGRPGAVGVERPHAAVDEGEGQRAHDAVPSVVTRAARVGFQPGRGTLARRSCGYASRG